MNGTIDIYLKGDKHKTPIFSTYETYDWYDGVILGIGQLNISNDFYLFELVAFDLTSKDRIFELIELEFDLSEKIKIDINKSNPTELKKMICELYSSYKSQAYLLKLKYIDDLDFNLVKIDSKHLRYYDSIEKVVNQNDKSSQKWFSFFIS